MLDEEPEEPRSPKSLLLERTISSAWGVVLFGGVGLFSYLGFNFWVETIPGEATGAIVIVFPVLLLVYGIIGCAGICFLLFVFRLLRLIPMFLKN
jgi:hypothetical protein